MAKTRLVAGIDVGSSKIATLIAQVTPEEQEINVVGVASVESRGVRKGQIVDIEEAAEAVVASVEKAERMAGYNLDRTFVSIGGGHIQSQNSHGVVAVADPDGEVGQDDVRRVIEAARAVSIPSSREIIHVLPRDFTVDVEAQVKDPVGMSGVRLEIETHLISASLIAIKNLTKCISEVGADIEGMVFGGLASAEASLSETEKELGVVLVDIGGGTTSIAAYVDGALAYSSVLPIGAKNVTNDLAIGLRVSLDSAEKIKLALGQKESKPTRTEKAEEEEEDSDELNLSSLGITEGDKKVSKKTLIDGIIKPRLNEIFTMVGLEIQDAGLTGRTPSGVVITGGGALTVGLQDAARRMLSLPIRIGYPKGVGGLIDDIQSPAFSTPIGLILWGAKYEGPPKISFGVMEKAFEQIPGKGMVGRAIEIIKGLLP